MSQSGSQAHKFYQEVATNRKVWTIRDACGFPAPKGDAGKRTQPFWSSFARAQRIIDTVPAYSDFQPVELSWEEFRDRWLIGLAKDGIQVGLNWSGKKATGFDMDPDWVKKCIQSIIDNGNALSE